MSLPALFARGSLESGSLVRSSSSDLARWYAAPQVGLVGTQFLRFLQMRGKSRTRGCEVRNFFQAGAGRPVSDPIVETAPRVVERALILGVALSPTERTAPLGGIGVDRREDVDECDFAGRAGEREAAPLPLLGFQQFGENQTAQDLREVVGRNTRRVAIGPPREPARPPKPWPTTPSRAARTRQSETGASFSSRCRWRARRSVHRAIPGSAAAREPCWAFGL